LVRMLISTVASSSRRCSGILPTMNCSIVRKLGERYVDPILLKVNTE
jgi:hypothetical protein